MCDLKGRKRTKIPKISFGNKNILIGKSNNLRRKINKWYVFCEEWRTCHLILSNTHLTDWMDSWILGDRTEIIWFSSNLHSSVISWLHLLDVVMAFASNLLTSFSYFSIWNMSDFVDVFESAILFYFSFNFEVGT